MSTPVVRAAWQALRAEHARMGETHLRALFTADPGRGDRWCLSAAGLYLDYSKNRIDGGTLDRLLALAEGCGLRERIDAMANGEPVNTTEHRAAMHIALRAPLGVACFVAGRDVSPQVQAVLTRMEGFSELLRSGAWRGHGGRSIRNVINLGIGGSDLGPAMACRALKHLAHPALQMRFVANVDPAALAEATQGMDPAETLFIVCSKSFRTTETLANLEAARVWCRTRLPNSAALARHFVAVTANLEAATASGIEPTQVFEVWDWVGGRYSMASAVGLSIMIAIGPLHFRALLAGMRAMDEHFRNASFDANMPVLMALLQVWNTNFLGASTQAVLPYAQALSRFPAYLQQLSMESNGKQTTRDGQPVRHDTASILWGEPGTDGQHSYHQLLHQGTRLVPCDFIGFARRGMSPDSDAGGTGPDDGCLDHQHDLLAANLFAQAEVLAFGITAAELRTQGVAETLVPHRLLPGNRPSNTLLARELTPHALGALVALYEHRVFTQSVLWDINAFDQWGVESGKRMAAETARELAGPDDLPLTHDASTNALMQRYRALRAERA